MARNVRAPVAAAVLKGYLLGEIVAFLISNAGYRLLTEPGDDPQDLTLRANGLQVRGRGGLHQADVLGELAWAPAFGNPIRLFVEAKWRGEGRRLGIPEARHAVGILQDVNQALATIEPFMGVSSGLGPEDTPVFGRGYCYSYRYALCSTSGFTHGAQAYALAHQVALLDLSHIDYAGLRHEVNVVGDRLADHIEGTGEDPDRDSRPTLVRTVRATLRQQLWNREFGRFDQTVARRLQPLTDYVRTIEELFIAVSATGFVILMKADNPRLMIRHMRARSDPHTTVHYRDQTNGSTQWHITLHSPNLDECKLSFSLPDAMLHALNNMEESGRSRSAMLDFKQQHFSRITVYRVTDTKSLICSLRLDRDWLTAAYRQTRTRERR